VENCDKILTIFRDIPDILHTAKKKRQMLLADPASSQAIQIELDKLYRTLFEAIPDFIQLLRRSRGKTAFMGLEIEELQRKITIAADGVSCSCQAIIGERTIATYQIAHETHKSPEANQRKTQESMALNQQMTETIHQELLEMKERFAELQQRM
jgi:hypothetical protein